MKLYFNPCPKHGKKPKAALKPLARSLIKPGRTKFKEFEANPLKTYRRRFSDAQVMAMAMKRRAERLAAETDAEVTFAVILNRLGIKYLREKIVLNGDRFVLLDFWLKKWNLVVEIDGSAHDNQKTYDHNRSMWLARVHKMKTVRFANKDVFNGKAELRIREMLGFSKPSSDGKTV